MNPINNAEAESMLWDWGNWVRSGKTGLLISSTNVIYRLNKEGAGASHSTVRTEPHMPPIVEVVERAMLTVYPKSIRRLCMHRYCGQEPDHIARKKLKLTQGEYEQRINQACHILADYLIEN